MSNGFLYVGNDGAGNQLTIANGGQVVVGYVYLGYNIGSSNNAVSVTGSGPVWNPDTVYVGYEGVGNQLTITNGGQVLSVYGYLGYYSSSNAVSVTGSGCWNNIYDVYVGYEGAGNQLTIADGGQVACNVGVLGNFSSSSNNVVLVTGAGSVWTNRQELVIGNYGPGNQLTIANGGQVFGGVAYLGGSSNNVALVTGSGSVWSTADNLYVGVPGWGNQLIVTNGGTVFARNLVLGGYAGGSGTLTLAGGTVNVAGLIATNATGVIAFNGGILTSSGTAVTNAQTFAVGDALDAATFQLTAGVHSFANGLEIRNNASLTGCGTVNGNVVVDLGGTVQVDCGGTLTFTGIVTNNGLMRAINGSTLKAYGLVVNNGTIDFTGGTTNFHGGFVNNGTVCPLTITTSSSPAGGGTTSGGGTVNCGSNTTVCAMANSGYVFVNWTLNSSVVSTSNCYTFTPGASENLVANFAPFQITAFNIQSSNVLVSWIAPEGSTNVVQATNGGAGGGYSTNFLAVSPRIVLPGANPATGFSTNYLDIGGATNQPSRYYRVALGNVTGIVVTQAFDNAAQPAYSGGWTNGSNGGTGFGPWTLTTTYTGVSTNGVFLGSSTNNAFGTSPGIDVGGQSWGIYANSGGAVAAYRGFNNSIPVDGTFRIDMDNGYIGNDDSDGFVLRSGNATNNPGNYNTNARFEFLYIGNDPSNSYKVVDNAGLYNIGVGFTGTGLHLVFNLKSMDTYNLLVIDNASGTTNATVNGTLGGTPGGTLDSLSLYNRSAGSGSQYDCFFNSMEIYGP